MSQFAVGQTWDKKLNTKQTPGAPAAYRRRSESVAVSLPFWNAVEALYTYNCIVIELSCKKWSFCRQNALDPFFLKFHLNDNS